jgi:hypothetical protein
MIRDEATIEMNDDGLFVLVDGKRIAVRDMDKATGEMIWRQLDRDWIVTMDGYEEISLQYVGLVKH